MPDLLPLICSARAGPPAWPEARSELRQFSRSLPPRHVHVIWGLSLGGAERIIADLARTWAECRTKVDIVVLQDRTDEHTLHPDLLPGIQLHRVGALSWPERYAYAARVATSSERPIYCHLMMSP